MWGLNCSMYLGVSTCAAGNQSSYQPGFGGSCINDVTACRWSGLGVGMAAALSHWLWQKSKLHPGFICYSLMWHPGLPTITFVVTKGAEFFSPPPYMASTSVAVFKCDSCHELLMWLLRQILFIQRYHHHSHHRTAQNALVARSKRNHQLPVCLSWGMNMQPCNFVATERSEG